MPSFEQSANSVNKNSYDKIVAIFNKNTTDNTVQGRVSQLSVSLKTAIGYSERLSSFPSGLYDRMAGQDLSTIFMPFEAKAGSSGSQLPCFSDQTVASGSPAGSGGVTLYDLLPFQWKPEETDNFYDRWNVPSGSIDSLPYVISGKKYTGDVNRYRDISSIRAIGQRLPMIGVGWGYTTAGDPFPSGANPSNPSGVAFKGGYQYGWQIDIADYVAAPIDFRYDIKNNVWTCSKDPGFWAEIIGFASGDAATSGSNYYQWIEKELNASGLMQVVRDKDGNQISRKGGKDTNPAFEVNKNINIPSGTHVWIPSKTNQRGAYGFEFNGDRAFWVKITGYTTISGATNRWKYSFVEQRLVRNGQFTDVTGGSGSVTAQYAFNSVEANNTVAGIQGNSIDLANLQPGFSLKPVQGSPVVRGYEIMNCDGDNELIFSYENAVDGVCT